MGTLPVLRVQGSRQEMARQYGYLVGDGIRGNIERTIGMFTGMGVPEPLVHVILDNAWKRLEPHTPSRFLDDMGWIAEGAAAAGHDVTLADIQRLTTVTNFDMYNREQRVFEFLDEEAGPILEQLGGQTPLQCTMFAVWGSRTVDGKMLALRNLDWVSQTGMHENRLVTVYAPDKGPAFATMGYAGVVGALAGMNANGISLSEIGAFSAREELDGTPWTLMARQVLEESASLEDGVDIIQKAKHTLGYNYMIADGDLSRYGTPAFNPRAAAFETNFECCEKFVDDDPKEHEAAWTDGAGNAIKCGLPLKEAVMRADMAFGKCTRALQVADNGPGAPENNGNPLEGGTYIECHKPMHDMVRAYENGSEYVYPLRGTRVIHAGAPRKIGVDEALTIAATVAHNTEKLEESDWNVMSVVYSPTDLKFWVAYESCDGEGAWKNAPDSGYWEFDLRELALLLPLEGG
jgi:hypothetical protein